jgi:protein ImuB
MHAASTSWLSIYLSRLNTDRLIRSGRAPEDKPLAIYAKEANAFVLKGVDARASSLGLKLAMSLADARAIQPNLAALEAEPDEDARTLDNIAAWCERFTPVVVIDAPDGLFLDISGCGHLFGGEEKLRAQIATRLTAQGFANRTALAPTPAAAWALARYGKTPIASADIVQTLAPLPVEALRLNEEAASLLRRVGLKTVGQLLASPRSSFTARAGEQAMLRLDQALGRSPEALTPRRPPPPVFALRRFLEPLFSVDAILEATKTLCADAVEKLDLRGAGARRAHLHLFGVDGRDRVIEIGASRPEREVKALMRLFTEKLSRAAENLDAEFGIEAARLDIVQLERIETAARTLVAVEEADAGAEKIAALVDVLSARLGPQRVLRPKLVDTHMPERAGAWRPALTSPSMGEVAAKRPEGVRPPTVKTKPQEAKPETPAGFTRSVALRATAPPSRGSVPRDGVMRRPLSIFARPQPIETLATVPDGPPIRFRWRRVLREVARAEGPERISGDWFGGEPTRDYYRVEDKDGRRYWLYREGLYGETDEAPRWFVHGLFA